MLNDYWFCLKKMGRKTHVMFDFENPGKKVTKDLSHVLFVFPGSKPGYCFAGCNRPIFRRRIHQGPIPRLTLAGLCLVMSKQAMDDRFPY